MAVAALSTHSPLPYDVIWSNCLGPVERDRAPASDGTAEVVPLAAPRPADEGTPDPTGFSMVGVAG